MPHIHRVVFYSRSGAKGLAAGHSDTLRQHKNDKVDEGQQPTTHKHILLESSSDFRMSMEECLHEVCCHQWLETAALIARLIQQTL